MGVKMTGVWTRKPDLEFADTQAMQEASFLAKFIANPFSIKTTPKLKAHYLEIYGADEEANLNANNMVQCSDERYVKGGIWVPTPKVTPRDAWMERIADGPTNLELTVETAVMSCLKRVFPERF